MVSALDSGSRGPGSCPGRVIVLCSWTRHFTLTVPVSTQEHKWVLVNCQGNLIKCWGRATCDWTSIPSGGGSQTPTPEGTVTLGTFTCNVSRNFVAPLRLARGVTWRCHSRSRRLQDKFISMAVTLDNVFVQTVTQGCQNHLK